MNLFVILVEIYIVCLFVFVLFLFCFCFVFVLFLFCFCFVLLLFVVVVIIVYPPSSSSSSSNSLRSSDDSIDESERDAVLKILKRALHIAWRLKKCSGHLIPYGFSRALIELFGETKLNYDSSRALESVRKKLDAAEKENAILKRRLDELEIHVELDDDEDEVGDMEDGDGEDEDEMKVRYMQN